MQENVDFITLGFDNYLEKGFRYTETYRMKNSATIKAGDNLTLLSFLQESIPTMRFMFEDDNRLQMLHNRGDEIYSTKHTEFRIIDISENLK